MTLEQLKELACSFFGVTEEELDSKKRDTPIIIAKHIFRTVAYVKYSFTQKQIGAVNNTGHDNVHNSIKTIIELEQFPNEYRDFLGYLEMKKRSAVSTVKDSKNGIERITNEAYDSRFYKHPEKLNTRTGLPYFPAFHYITSLGAPESIGLSKWRQDKGHFADYILTRSAAIGSYVHDCIDRMIKSNIVVEHEDIHKAFPDEKEAQKVKDCLLGFLNFMRDEEPIITASERMMCGDDFGLTQDNEFYLKSDSYKFSRASDWKTSKVVSEDHKMQVEVIRRVSGATGGLVVVLGNQTKKKYTATKIKPSEYEYLWERFNAIKETAYVEILKRGLIKPREDNMPHVFSLNDLKIRRKI